MKKRNKVELTINLANQLPSDINKHTKTVLLIYFNIIAFLWFKKTTTFNQPKSCPCNRLRRDKIRVRLYISRHFMKEV